MTETPPYLQRFVLPVEEHTPDRVGDLDLYRPDGDRRLPAILFVHGGPAAPDLAAPPRDWPVFRGYGAAAVDRGVVGAIVDHSLVKGLDQLTTASDQVESAVGLLRADPQVDPNRVALWFFSGAGLLAGEWLDSRPEWLRCVALTYPRLSTPAGTPELTSAIEVIGKQPELPVLLTWAGLEREDFVAATEEFVAAAQAGGAALEIIEVPNGRHGFDMLDHTDESRLAVARALDWTIDRLMADGDRPVKAPRRSARSGGDSQTARKSPAESKTSPAASKTERAVRPKAPEPEPPAAPPWPVTEATGVVAKHLEAFGARDLEGLLGTFAPNAQVYALDGSVASGRRALREHYAAQLDAGSVRVEVLSRIAEGEWVVDHQAVHGDGAEPLRLIVIHRVHAGSIAQVQFLV